MISKLDFQSLGPMDLKETFTESILDDAHEECMDKKDQWLADNNWPQIIVSIFLSCCVIFGKVVFFNNQPILHPCVGFVELFFIGMAVDGFVALMQKGAVYLFHENHALQALLTVGVTGFVNMVVVVLATPFILKWKKVFSTNVVFFIPMFTILVSLAFLEILIERVESIVPNKLKDKFFRLEEVEKTEPLATRLWWDGFQYAVLFLLICLFEKLLLQLFSTVKGSVLDQKSLGQILMFIGKTIAMEMIASTALPSISGYLLYNVHYSVMKKGDEEGYTKFFIVFFIALEFVIMYIFHEFDYLFNLLLSYLIANTFFSVASKTKRKQNKKVVQKLIHYLSLQDG